MITTLPRACSRTFVRCAPFTSTLLAALAAANAASAQHPEFANLVGRSPGVTTQAAGPVANFNLANDDNCVTSTDTQSGPGFYAYDLSAATTGIQGQGNQLCNYYGQSNVASDVWFRWSATWTGRAELSTCGDSVDTRIAVYSGGASCPVGNALACNDDACGLQSNLIFDVTNGTTYLVQLGTFPGATAGAGTLTITDLAPTCAYQEDPDSGRLDAIGLNNGGELAYLDYFEATGGSDVITQVSVAFGTIGGNLPDGNTARIVIWNDPTNDSNPSDATVLWSLATTTVNSNTGMLNDYAVPNIAVTGGFFVGAIVQHAAGEFAAVYDLSQNSFGRAWLVGQVGGTVDPANLAGAGVAPLPINALLVTLGADGFFLVRASGLGNNCGGGGPGTNYCSANPNSTGQTGLISGAGSASVAANTLTLQASRLPNNAFGYFITGVAQANIANPAGSQGVLCLSGSVGRYVGPGQIKNTGTTGSFSLLLNLTQIPTPGGFVSAVAGQTRYFQAWHRDAVGGAATSNFTDGLQVVFL